ncbi:hypothetical protein JAAARDRAFT_168280 [Jaapia argillacea MUCL 33604]|uniref:Uncharacterized protein n=1 Tax=Jaapia argillacea MUCL 33604 TaxID=933084 RepID=A0A067QK29_9AGAM|nr:hypothetical protein JAAARDRAFT_168280 [Jaapia argillacea MUCL 33604]
MPSKRSRSRSLSRERDRERDRSRSPESRTRLPDGVSEISDSDYFLKNAEFRVWLKEEKGKYFDELSGEKARSYFRKFVKAWNRGKLSKSIYAGVGQSTQNPTAYKWSFTSNSDRKEREAIKAAREEVEAANYAHNGAQSSKGGTSTSSGRVLGPTLPSQSDLVMAREAASEFESTERAYKRKRERAEAKERVEDMVGPKPVGREGMLEKKRAQREDNKAFRERGDEGFVEADESTLMGGGDSFRERIVRRDAARKRFEEKRAVEKDEKFAGTREKMKEKEKATMDMFMKMAQQRFG